MNNEYVEYLTRRKRDVRCEELAANFLDRNFYSRLHQFTFERVKPVDDESVTRQKLGEDVVLRDKDENVKYVIDEKAKLQGCLNNVITFPSFEIIRRPLPDVRHTLGWFSYPDSHTTHYALISLASDRKVKPHHEYTLNDSDITCAVYGLVNKKDLLDWLKKQTFKNIEQVTNDAYQLFHEWKLNPRRQKWGTSKIYREDWRGKYIYLKLSGQLDNHPVNLVIRRDVLRTDGLIKEFYVDDRRAVKYKPPHVFTPAGETLTRQDD